MSRLDGRLRELERRWQGGEDPQLAIELSGLAERAGDVERMEDWTLQALCLAPDSKDVRERAARSLTFLCGAVGERTVLFAATPRLSAKVGSWRTAFPGLGPAQAVAWPARAGLLLCDVSGGQVLEFPGGSADPIPRPIPRRLRLHGARPCGEDILALAREPDPEGARRPSWYLLARRVDELDWRPVPLPEALVEGTEPGELAPCPGGVLLRCGRGGSEVSDRYLRLDRHPAEPSGWRVTATRLVPRRRVEPAGRLLSDGRVALRVLTSTGARGSQSTQFEVVALDEDRRASSLLSPTVAPEDGLALAAGRLLWSHRPGPVCHAQLPGPDELEDGALASALGGAGQCPPPGRAFAEPPRLGDPARDQWALLRQRLGVEWVTPGRIGFALLAAPPSPDQPPRDPVPWLFSTAGPAPEGPSTSAASA